MYLKIYRSYKFQYQSLFVCFLCLCWAGMGKFDALNHAMATIATGGLSTKNASIGYFDSVALFHRNFLIRCKSAAIYICAIST